MVTSVEVGNDLFKIARCTISAWTLSFKMGKTSSAKHPLYRQRKERLLLWFEYYPRVVSHAHSDINPIFAAAYRLSLPKHALLLMKAVDRKILRYGYQVFDDNRLSCQECWYVSAGLLSRLQKWSFEAYYRRGDISMLYLSMF